MVLTDRYFSFLSIKKKKATNFYTGNMCKPVDGISHSNSCFDAKSITSISATSRWKIPWGEQFKLFYTDKQILREFVTFAPQTPQVCLIEFLKPIHNYE